MKAHAQKYNQINILHFDAHPDLYDSLDNNPYSHACPFAR
ncbi:MAG: agmatinase, partial [Desulfobacteraceae bacterium]|nr:agmatinase [Desulfobacteraceae bacterium]